MPSSRTPTPRAAKKAPDSAAAAPKARRRASTSSAPEVGAASASALIDAKIEALADWRGALLARLRTLVRQAVPGVVEEWKWQTPVWSHHGLICTGETYKKAVKMTFAHGASVEDPAGLFNSSLEGKVRRAIDFHEGEALDEAALTALFQAAAAWNEASARR